MTAAKKKPAKTQTNVLLTETARAILKTLALPGGLMPIKLSESDVIETLLVEEAKRRGIKAD
jgi:hypothetical protein